METMRRYFALKHQLYDASRFYCPAPINSDRSDYFDWNRVVCHSGYRYYEDQTETQRFEHGDLSDHSDFLAGVAFFNF